MTDEEKIITRILDVLPPSSFELATFLSLFRVRFSEKTKTACVTCGESPELLLNKDFIEAHCQTNEHLFMLVMHELYHVILGHTTLFPHATEVRNLVFDAVINAILCSLFPTPEFTSFFTDYYPSDKMPSALLRPKGEGTPLAAEQALKFLYGGSDTGTYHDVYEVLLQSGCIKEIKLVVKSDGEDGEPLLLGSHNEENEEISQEMKDLIHKIISKWPSPDRPLQGQDLGAEECERGFDAEADPSTRLRRGIRRLMRRAVIPGKKEVRRRSVREIVCETATFLPDWHDRSHEAREIAFGDALIYSTTTRLQRPSSRDNRQAFVYFDVSGSVAEEVPSVAQALLPYCRADFARSMCFRRSCIRLPPATSPPGSSAPRAGRTSTASSSTSSNCRLESGHVPPSSLRTDSRASRTRRLQNASTRRECGFSSGLSNPIPTTVRNPISHPSPINSSSFFRQD